MPVEFFWGLFSARREDLEIIYNAGFRAVRPNYPDDVPSPQPSSGNSQTDNYQTTRDYVIRARDIGFQKVIYGLNLPWMREEFGPDIQDVKDEITAHIDSISGVQGINCTPYVDEPETWVYADPQNPPVCDSSTTPQYNQLIGYYKELIQHIKQEAADHYQATHVATFIPDVVCCCDPMNQVCDDIPISCREKWASYEFNNCVDRLILTNYRDVSDMTEIMRAAALNYNQHIQQLINFYDLTHGCRGACEVQDIFNQIHLNRQYSGAETWFYQGGRITAEAQQQWQKLLQAIADYEETYGS